jgi:geranylgeranyl reductase family protein
MHDVIIVGGGPAGSLAAKDLAAQGLDVLVLEEHESVGLPQHCTGLISEETLHMSGVRPDILNTLYGAEVVFPDGQTITVESDKPKAKIVSRVDLDVRMAQAAMDAGAVYSFSDKYQTHSVDPGVMVRSTTGMHETRVVIGADGASSAVAMTLGDNRPKEYIRGIQADVRYVMEDQSLFKLFLGNKVAPGFFAWQIPCGSFTRIGLCTSWSSGAPSEYLSNMLIRMGMQDRIMKVYSGKIPIGRRALIYGDRCLLAGDALGYVKPLSGGGLYPAFKANKHLVNVLTGALDSDMLFGRDLSEYDRACNADFGKEMDHMYGYRQRFKRLTDSDFNKCCDIIRKNDLVSILKDLDIDHPNEVIKKVTKMPKVVMSALPLLMRSYR